MFCWILWTHTCVVPDSFLPDVRRSKRARKKYSWLKQFLALCIKKVVDLPSIVIREFKQIPRAGATTAAVTEKVWGEYISVVCQILAKRNTKMSET